MSASAARTCSQCGAPLPASAPGQRCPKCLLALGLEAAGQNASGPRQSDFQIEPTGTLIGRYRILQQIGEGGFGTVFMAEQTEPVERKVALKIIKAGMDSKEIISRFEAERQALALMDHPNIARVLDGGTTESGRPYFVMELVRGMPITNYCDQAKLSTRERLELFIKVCRAVQHAHQKGVIHRDLKPGNVLVTLHDGEPVPKVIDFGVAKALGQKLTDKTLFTRFEQMLGTPAYMSPEQAALSGLDIDTRSDIYSLGVLLYELLTGVTPLDAETLRQEALDEVRRMIRETDPPRPSTRLTALVAADVRRLTSAQSEQDRASLRRLLQQKRELIGAVRGDLDWITMKALEKDRQRRYETVNGLAMDIERHLNCEPVVARPPSRLYEFQKTVRRHKFGFAAAAALVLVLAAGVVGSTWQAVRATRAEREQALQRKRADDETAHAKRAEQETREQLWHSYLNQARANRWSGRAGRRFESLEVLRKAAEIRPSPELRNEAIACLALPDVRPLKEWDAPADSSRIWFDCAYQRYAVGQTNGILSVRRVSDDVELERVTHDFSPFTQVWFSPDGRLLAVRHGKDSQADIWNLVAHEPLLKALIPATPAKSWCREIIFRADSRVAAMAQVQDNKPPTTKVRIFDLETRREVTSWEMNGVSCTMRFSPTETNLLLITDSSSLVRLWDWPSQRIVKTFEHPDWVQGVAWHPDGRLLAAGCGDHMIYLWALDKEGPLKVLKGHENSVTEVLFDGESGLLASSSWDGTLRLWDPMIETPLVSRPSSSVYNPLAKRRLASHTLDKVTLLEVANGEECRMLHSALELGKAGHCTFHPNGQLLAVAHTDGVQLWLVEQGKELARLRIPDVYAVLFHPDGRSLMVSTDEGLSQWPVEFHSSDRGLELRLGPPNELGEKGKMEHMAVTPDGDLLAVIEVRAAEKGGGRFVHVFDMQTRRELFQAKAPARGWFVTLSPDKKFLAVSDFGTTEVWVWDLAGKTLLQKLRATTGSHVVFSPDNQWMVTTDHREQRLWRVGSRIVAFSRQRDVTEGNIFATFSSDGKILAYPARNSIRLLAVPSLAELATLECPSPLILGSLSFSPDGSQLAATSGARLIELWDLRLVRQQLAAMKLDWDAPPLPPPATNGFAGKVVVTVVGTTNENSTAERSPR
jgi:serine/threonine protein kinase/WD40 repeat protein